MWNVALLLAFASVDSQFLEPGDMITTYIYNRKYSYSRLAHWDSGCGFYSGNQMDDQLWRFEEHNIHKGAYFIYNFKHGDRYATDGNDAYCFNDSYDDNQLWTFEKSTFDNYYYIVNFVHNGCRLAMWDKDQGGIYCGIKMDDQVFRFENPFETHGGWIPVDMQSNKLDHPVPYTFSTQMGFSETITKSVAFTVSTEMSLQASVGAAVDVMNLSETWSAKVTSSFTKSYSDAQTNTFQVTKTIGPIDIAAGECMELRQIILQNSDSSRRNADFPLGTLAWETRACSVKNKELYDYYNGNVTAVAQHVFYDMTKTRLLRKRINN